MSKLDYDKIFIKDACPTSIGGQAVMEGVMMQGPDRIALAMRLPSGELYLRTKVKPEQSKWMKVPVVRGVVAFINSLVIGMGTLMESADILELYAPEQYAEEPSRFEKWLNVRFGPKAAWNFLMIMSVVLALIITIVGFVIFPTVVVNWLNKWIESAVVLNLIEGIFRILLFVLYVVAIRRMKDIYTLFQYHGAEHKSIHCFENNFALTPANAEKFPTLHPRCGTSFLVFVLIISLLLFSFLGWPNLLLRILSRVLLIPVIAGLSYELLKWAGRSDNAVVRILSYPGLMLQKLTTAEPTLDQIEVGELALKAVLVSRDAPLIDGFVDKDGNRVNEFDENDFFSEEPVPVKEPTISADYEQYSESAPKEVPNTLRALLNWGESALSNIENGKNEAMMILSYATGKTRSDVIAHGSDRVREGDMREYMKRIKARVEGTPLQYIVGTQEFMGLMFRVNPSVLIPRMDTEVLVEQVLEIISSGIFDTVPDEHTGINRRNLEILDLCTGSGAIGISVASKVPSAIVTLTDVSEAALNTAIGNAGLNHVNRQCVFLLGNLYEALPEGKRYNLIVSNPPYIESAVIRTLATEVRDHEPRIALDGGVDGLDFYRRIIAEAPKYLEPGGVLALEIGCDQAEKIRALVKETDSFGPVHIVKDLAGLDRVAIMRLK